MAAGGGQQSSSWTARAVVGPLPPESYSAVYVRQWGVSTTPEWCVHTQGQLLTLAQALVCGAKTGFTWKTGF